MPGDLYTVLKFESHCYRGWARGKRRLELRKWKRSYFKSTEAWRWYPKENRSIPVPKGGLNLSVHEIQSFQIEVHVKDPILLHSGGLKYLSFSIFHFFFSSTTYMDERVDTIKRLTLPLLKLLFYCWLSSSHLSFHFCLDHAIFSAMGY